MSSPHTSVCNRRAAMGPSDRRIRRSRRPECLQLLCWRLIWTDGAGLLRHRPGRRRMPVDDVRAPLPANTCHCNLYPPPPHPSTSPRHKLVQQLTTTHTAQEPDMHGHHTGHLEQLHAGHLERRHSSGPRPEFLWRNCVCVPQHAGQLLGRPCDHRMLRRLHLLDVRSR